MDPLTIDGHTLTCENDLDKYVRDVYFTEKIKGHLMRNKKPFSCIVEGCRKKLDLPILVIYNIFVIYTTMMIS